MLVSFPIRRHTNYLLTALPPDAYALLKAHWEPIELAAAEYLQVPGEVQHYVYFPTGACYCLGMSGRAAPSACRGVWSVSKDLWDYRCFLGAQCPRWQAQVQLAGTALRLPAEILRQSCSEKGPLTELLRDYTDTLLAQVIQNAACGRFHSLLNRLARWLLMTDDRSDSSIFLLTHQVLGELLGVRREAVSTAAGVLQRHQLISYRRGNLRILDRTGLEAMACTCDRGKSRQRFV